VKRPALLPDVPEAARDEPAWRQLFRPRIALMVLAGAALLGMAESLQVYAGTAASGRPIPLLRSITSTLPSWLLWAAGLPLVWWLGDRYRVERGRLGAALAVHVPASVLFAIAHLTAAALLSDVVLYADPLPVPFVEHVMRLFSIYFMVALTMYWAMLGIFYALDYGRKYRAHERRAGELALRTSRLETSLANASLETLRAQLNPHFLFNALNTVSVLAMKGERQAVVRMLARLSDLLRISLRTSRQVVSLEEELELLDHYLAIEETRFRDRLTVERMVEEDALRAAVPSLLLQPIVENAVRHGISRDPMPGRIRIRAFRKGARLLLEVADTGPGFGEEAPSGTGLGLANTRARLEQLYGRRHRMTTGNRAEGGAFVHIEIPFRRYSREDAEAGAPESFNEVAI
jgi:two-component system, LytTR family, sensor kinase